MTVPASLKEIVARFKSELGDQYPADEIRNICYLVAEQLLNYSKIDFHLNGEAPISANIAEKFMDALGRLKNWEPVQYVTGQTTFMDLDLRVNNSVLIPRPETEELADWIIRDERPGVHILDMGTGSGCIAIALAVHVPEAVVSACDVSEAALALARSNSAAHGNRVNFFSYDLLQQQEPLPGKFDVMVSNPPYVRQQEAVLMRPNVRDHEPGLALFVPDADPLLFYRQIALLARRFLHDGGRLYLEINEHFPHEVCRVLENAGLFGTTVRRDLSGRARMVKAFK
jgi:release factor glutamine methyltransferase